MIFNLLLTDFNPNPTIMKKQPMSPERLYPILKSVHMIGVLAEIIKVEHRVRVIDTKFRQPSTNNHANRIVESAGQIQKDLTFQFKCMDREELTIYSVDYCSKATFEEDGPVYGTVSSGGEEFITVYNYKELLSIIERVLLIPANSRNLT